MVTDFWKSGRCSKLRGVVQQWGLASPWSGDRSASVDWRHDARHSVVVGLVRAAGVFVSGRVGVGRTGQGRWLLLVWVVGSIHSDASTGRRSQVALQLVMDSCTQVHNVNNIPRV